MLIRFAVENYSSFKERQVFTMAAGKQTRHPDHYAVVNGKRLLKGSFFFGANAAGKSNFIKAVDFVRRMVLFGTRTMRYFDRRFLIDPACKEKPGVFQVDLMENQAVYSYGFAVEYATHKINGEWLYRIDSAGGEQCIFERDETGHVETDIFERGRASTRFKIYCEDLKESDLLLHEMGNKNLRNAPEFKDFVNVYQWFKRVVIVYPDSHPRNRSDFFLRPTADTQSLVDMLHAFDTGIENIKKGRQPLEAALSFLPEQVKKNILDDVAQSKADKLGEGDRCVIEIEEHQFELSFEGEDCFAEKIMLDHGNSDALLELSDESDGTRRLFDLIPLYDLGKKGRIIFIDELDRSLHTKLTEKFINCFFERMKGKNSQMICTTHDTNIMDLKLLRQDEIWFVEREEDHSTRIYSLNDYKQRFDKNVLNDYLIGRYGAIPCFKDE